MTKNTPDKSPSEIATEIAEDNSIDDAVAIRKLMAITIALQEDTVMALWDIRDALGFKEPKH